MSETPPNRRYPALGFLVTGAFAVFVIWFTFGDHLLTAAGPPIDHVATGSID